MSAKDLRRAADSLRRDWPVNQFCPDGCNCNSDSEYHPSADIYQRMADWLDAVAERQDPRNKWARRSHGWTGSREANAVARLINGASDD